MIAWHRFRGVLGVQNWVRSFKLLDAGLGGAGGMELKLVGEVCAREFWEGLARRDADADGSGRKRRGRHRVAGKAGWGWENGFVLSIEEERGVR